MVRILFYALVAGDLYAKPARLWRREYVKNGVIRHYIGKARWSWVDIEDVAASLLDPEKRNGQIYRLGHQAATYDQIAAIFTEVIRQPFRMKRARQKSSIETSWRLAPNQPT
jgi:uncharacterized protein YbjT (DUF2867 family)